MKIIRDISKSSVVPIVRDGAIATHEIGEGRMVPVLIVDCSDNVELLDLIYAHEETPPGDVIVTWGIQKDDKNNVSLILEFLKPSALQILLQFNIELKGGVVDSIFHANALYLQPLESGERVIDGLDSAKILVEVPDTGFFETWDELYTEKLIRVFKKSGLSRKEANKAAKQHKDLLRGIWLRRMRNV
ncbi:hypothetical protein [Methylotenera sp.]|uniref:hypothetical protein n=1 Tax=Methylotenera sp. TaxID=2051956 RepID=UPI0027307C75|nr:hypothetical protein [Methylotenera sp.]MDP1959023.1 hypothetical protein [Methylotenera sp.]MDP2230348.1 hypothetical protein [Methylotenera sp.]